MHDGLFFVRPEISFLASKTVSIVRPNRLPGVRFAQTSPPKRSVVRAKQPDVIENMP